MRAQTLPARAGWQWLLGGYVLYRRNPAVLTLLVLAYWFIVLFLNLFPMIGAVAASLVIPGLSVGLMQVARHVERGSPANLQTLLGGLRQNARTLCLLGLLYLACSLGILGLSSLFDDGQFLNALLLGRSDPPAGDEAGSLAAMLVVLGLLTPLLMAYWFAPVLAGWHGVSLGKALFFSFVACWLNWRAFLAYWGGILLLMLLLPLVLLLAIPFPDFGSVLTALLLTVVLLVGLPSLYASFYLSYRDIFGISELV